MVYFENEDAGIHHLLAPNFVANLANRLKLTPALMAALHRLNGGTGETPKDVLAMAEAHTLKLAIVISGQGPVAYGMPEMATTMMYVMASKVLKPLVTTISDGRFSGVNYGAAIGHVTPEAIRGGGILYLQDGDLIHLRLRKLRLDLLDREAMENSGEIRLEPGDFAADRASLGEERMARLLARRRGLAPTNLLSDCTDAAHGVVPQAVAEYATETYAPMTVGAFN